METYNEDQLKMRAMMEQNNRVARQRMQELTLPNAQQVLDGINEES